MNMITLDDPLGSLIDLIDDLPGSDPLILLPLRDVLLVLTPLLTLQLQCQLLLGLVTAIA